MFLPHCELQFFEMIVFTIITIKTCMKITYLNFSLNIIQFITSFLPNLSYLYPSL